MKASSALKWLAIALATVCGLFLSTSLFLRTEAGRAWAEAQVLEWIQKEYGVSIAFQSFEFSGSARGWDFIFHSLVWKVHPEAPGQAIEELRISLNPSRLLLEKPPLTSITIKGLLLKPDLTHETLHLRGAGLMLQRSQLTSWLTADSPDKDTSEWPEILVEKTRVDIGYFDNPLLSLDLAGQWSAREGFHHLSLETPGVDLARLMDLTLRFAPAFSERIKTLPRLEKGRLENLKVLCQAGFDCQGEANLRHALWQEKGFIPGVSELSARLDFGNRFLNITIPQTLRKLTWSALYKKPVAINFFGSRVQIRLEDDAIVLRVPKTEGTWNKAPFEAEAALNIPRRNTAKSRIHMTLKAPQLPWSTVRSVLPDVLLSQDLKEWLLVRIQKAEIKNFTAQMEGQLLDFPFAKKQSGRLSLDADVAGLQLKYHDDWPLLKNCQGRFLLRNTAIGINGISCQSSGIRADQGKLDLTDMQTPEARLGLSFQVKDSLQAAGQFLQKTPLNALARMIEILGLRAAVQTTALNLQIPLGSGSGRQSFELQGRTLVSESAWALPREILKGTMRNLILDFDQMGLKDLKADVTHEGERAQLTVARDEARNRLDLKLKPLDARTGLAASLWMAPADQPTRVEGQITDFVLADGAARISLESLRWQGSDRPVEIKGRAEIKDFGRVWSAADLGKGFQGGHGSMVFDLQLPGTFSIERPDSLAGHLDYDLKDGRIDQLSSTAKALINVANLKILGINSGSIDYPFLRGRLVFNHGSLFTENSVMGLGALEIQAKGSVDYFQESMDLQLTIIPDLGSPATSLAIGLWNPLVGLGLWGYSKLHGKASDSRLNRLASQSYRMKGPTSKPEISLISLLHLKEAMPWTHSLNKNGAIP